MKNEYQVTTLPRRQDQILLVPLGLLLIAAGIMIALSVWLTISGSPVFALLVSLVGLAPAGIGLHLLRGATLRIRLFPEGIAVMNGARGVFQIPAEELRLVCELYVFNGKRHTRMIGLSAVSLEELAEKREQELRKNPFSKYNVDIRKRNANWVSQFAQEYLTRCAKGYPVRNLRGGILWLTWSEDVRDLLLQTYPGAEHRIWKRTAASMGSRWKDPDPADFCRGWVRRDTMGSLGRLYLSIAAWLLWLEVIAPSVGGVVFLAILFFAALFGGLFLLLGGEYDRVRVTESMVAVYRNGRVYQWLPVGSIKTVLRIPINGNSSTISVFGPEESMLLVTDQSMEELAAAAMEATKKRRDARDQIALWAQLPQPERYAVADYLTRKAETGFYRFSKDLIFGYAPGREEILRKCLPDAQWMDLRCEVMD